jgi:hypothetical protein
MAAIIPFLLVIIMLSLFILWVKMVIRAISSNSEPIVKVLWILGMLFTGPIVAIVYYFASKPNPSTGSVTNLKGWQVAVIILVTIMALAIAGPVFFALLVSRN